VCGQRQEINMSRIIISHHVDVTVRRQLRCVDEQLCTRAMCPFRDVMNRRANSRDVRRPVDRNESDAPSKVIQCLSQRGKIKVTVMRNPDVNYRSVLAPGQIVGMVFHDRRDHDIAPGKVETA